MVLRSNYGQLDIEFTVNDSKAPVKVHKAVAVLSVRNTITAASACNR